MNSGVLISFADLTKFSTAAQNEIAEFVKGQTNWSSAEPTESAPSQIDAGEAPPDLTVAQAKKFLDRVSNKVRTTLRVIAEADPEGFDLAAVMEALDAESEGSLGGVWSGITKRTRKILKEDGLKHEDVRLIWWTDEEHDWVGRVSATTHRSFRKVFGI
tara:strand:- start:332 stop:808 length:477 start_codon:yes stop_codon:yes gene_type:complete